MRVLIADDEATSRLVLKAMVARLGHESLVVDDGDKAWDILASQEIDVLLTDWLMPGVNGPELCRRAREERADHYVYVVLVTALDCPEQVLEGMKAGADDYLVKPVDGLVLETRLVAAERVTKLQRQVAHFQAELEMANQELLAQSLTDPLTGLGNRRRMEQDLIRIHDRSVRSGRPYGVAMFDVDHFKSYNDHYGHPAGDEILRRVAALIDGTTRSGEVVYRYGGEEFLLLLADADEGEAFAGAERVRQAIATHAIPHGARPTKPPLITVSAGVAVWNPSSGRSVEDVLEGADQHLFDAKNHGRNRVAGLVSGPSASANAEMPVAAPH
jgi:two-component system cell cycle response regulator